MEYHPGTCTKTARGQRYGAYLTPQRFDDPGHTWHLAKSTNWGPWSCCGRPVNSTGCQLRDVGSLTTPTPSRGIGAYIQFLINGNDRVLVVGANERCWLLSSGRVAKKRTEGSSWVWADGEASPSITHFLSRLSLREPQRSFYSFGNWGYHTNDHDSQVMAGFSLTPPGVEICGSYKIIFVAALRYDTNQQQANIYLRRQPKSGRVVIRECSRPFAIGVGGRIGSTIGASRTVVDQATFDGEVFLSGEGRAIDRYFGPGYRFYGFATDSDATSSYSSMAANASLIVTKRNDNKGRIYRVESPKAFKLVHNERGNLADESASFDSQEQEANEARRICNCRHYSFLCRELGLPCSASALVTAFVTEQPPFIFAEPGDIWIDIRLSTPNRTYVLARRTSREVPPLPITFF